MAQGALRILVCLVAVAITAGGCSSSGHGPTTATAPVKTASTPQTPQPRVHRRHRRAKRAARVPAIDLPNRRLTPGVALNVRAAQVCRPGYASSVRNVPESEKEAVYARYRVPHVPYAHEVDHLVSLELGGSNDIRNLWPEPYAGRWGARTKDVLENRLHDLVCSGRLTLRFAQRIEARNWVAAYRRYAAAAVAAPASSSRGGFYASSYPTAHTIYCADDPSWKNLSKRYLTHFATLARARRRFPGYRLHRPC
ncbi:MAG TPA: hypothetical protein VEG40_06750 [Gaiellaceae bacterium]|nr:hypothetical protein [Gaiellaceae bacterium]